MNTAKGEVVDGLVIRAYDLDDPLLEAAAREGRVRHRLYRPQGVQVVLGRGSRPENELNIGACLEDRVSVYRRYGGGCPVVLDPGNIIVSVVLPVTGFAGNPGHFARLTRWLTAGLERVGIEGVRQRGISDLALGERKIGGACIYRTRDRLFYSATLLVDPDTELMERYLAHPPREPDYRKGRSHRHFVTALSREFPGIGGAQELLESLSGQLPSPDQLDMLTDMGMDAD